MQLHSILQGCAFCMFVLGAAAGDSDIFLIPAVLYLGGLVLLLWSAYENGSLAQWKRRHRR